MSERPPRTEQQTATCSARVAYRIAHATAQKTDSPDDHKHAGELATALAIELHKLRRENFTRVVTNRVAKILGAVEKLSSAANRQRYDFTLDDLAYMFAAIDAKLKDVRLVLELAVKTHEKTQGEIFSFDRVAADDDSQ